MSKISRERKLKPLIPAMVLVVITALAFVLAKVSFKVGHYSLTTTHSGETYNYNKLRNKAMAVTSKEPSQSTSYTGLQLHKPAVLPDRQQSGDATLPASKQEVSQHIKMLKIHSGDYNSSIHTADAVKHASQKASTLYQSYWIPDWINQTDIQRLLINRHKHVR